ncbi:MAG: MnmC family methyltransferase, partial [Planctomycetes bacterium]|nr:MnmC family methyltransferase [Planctomycetota bacterium]
MRLLDVGSAPGWNLAAACSVAGLLPGSLEVTAVERSEEALAAGLELSSEMSWRAGAPSGAGSALELAHSGLRAARGAADGGWVSLERGLRMRLHMGCVRELVSQLGPQERFDAVFLDCFSPGVEPEAWEAGFLFELGQRVAEAGRLTTYTISHPVRAALMASGLKVGWPGARSGRRGGTWASRGGWVPPLSERLQ